MKKEKKQKKKLHDYKNLMFKDILSNLWCVLHPCLHFKLVASSVKPGGFPQTQQRWWRGPGSAWGCRALRCIGLCCSTSWSSCRRSCLCQSPHLQSCCISLLLGNPSSWCPQIQLWNNKQRQRLPLRVLADSLEFIICQQKSRKWAKFSLQKDQAL